MHAAEEAASLAMRVPGHGMNKTTFPEAYERWLVDPLFRPWAEVILDELELSPDDRVLDIACGTGIVSRVAMERLPTASAM